MVAALQEKCPGVAAATCRVLEWVKVVSPEIDCRLYAGDAVAIRVIDDNVAKAAAAAAAAAGLPPSPPPPVAVLSEFDARYTSSGAIQAFFETPGKDIFAVVHAYANATASLIATTPGFVSEKTCPRVLGPTSAVAGQLAHLIVIPVEHIEWKFEAQLLHKGGLYPTAHPGYPIVGYQRILFPARADPDCP